MSSNERHVMSRQFELRSAEPARRPEPCQVILEQLAAGTDLLELSFFFGYTETTIAGPAAFACQATRRRARCLWCMQWRCEHPMMKCAACQAWYDARLVAVLSRERERLRTGRNARDDRGHDEDGDAYGDDDVQEREAC